MENNKIVNLTQHVFTADQIQDIESRGLEIVEIDQGFKNLLNFETLPEPQTIREKTFALSQTAKEAVASFAMIGGAPYFMSHLEEELFDKGIKPLYAFSIRSSVDRPKEDGTVEKLSVFKHLGFIEPENIYWQAYQRGLDDGFDDGYHRRRR